MAGNHMSELSPRQRMINMMYLVLTALLALNVSKEVLEAFAKMDNSIEYAYGDKYVSNEKQYQDFKNRAEKNPEKFQEWYMHALNVQRESKEILDSIQSVKNKIEFLAGGYDKDGMLVKKDDKDLVKKLLVKDPSEKGAYGYGVMLVNARDKYRNFLLSLDSLNIYLGNDSKVKDRINQILNTDDVDEDPTDP
jgi:gliding motility-associated protein GldM